MTKRTTTVQYSIDMFIKMSEDNHKKTIDAIDRSSHTPSQKEKIKGSFKDQFKLKMMEGVINKLVEIIDQQDTRLADLEDHLASLRGENKLPIIYTANVNFHSVKTVAFRVHLNKRKNCFIGFFARVQLEWL